MFLVRFIHTRKRKKRKKKKKLEAKDVIPWGEGYCDVKASHSSSLDRIACVVPNTLKYQLVSATERQLAFR